MTDKLDTDRQMPLEEMAQLEGTPICYLCSLSPRPFRRTALYRVKCHGGSVFACGVHKGFIQAAASQPAVEAEVTDLSEERS